MRPVDTHWAFIRPRCTDVGSDNMHVHLVINSSKNVRQHRLKTLPLNHRLGRKIINKNLILTDEVTPAEIDKTVNKRANITKYRQYIHDIRFWNRLVNMDTHRLTKHIFQSDALVSMTGKRNWSYDVNLIIQHLRLHEMYLKTLSRAIFQM